MLKLNENYEVGRIPLICDFLRYLLAEISTINTPTSQISFNIPREDSVFPLLNSYLDLNFEVIEKAENSRYANGNDIRLVNLGPIVLFSKFILRKSSGKRLENISQAHIVSLMYKSTTSAKDSDDLSIGFDRGRVRKKRKININKNIKVKYHVRIMLKDVFGFSENQGKTTYGLG